MGIKLNSKEIEDLEEEIATIKENIKNGLNDIEDVEDYIAGLEEELESLKTLK